jgi:hypothetical protein
MVLEAGRAYSRATRATRSARPRRIARATFARRAFGGCFLAGTAILGAIAVLSPAQFGQPGAATLKTGWPSLALVGAIAVGVLYAILRRRQLIWLVERVREPLLRPLNDAPGWDDAVDALESCPSPLRARFAFSWVWAPVAGALLGGTFAFSSAYFLVDAILARFRVGWGQPVYGLSFAALSLIVFSLTAGRLASWRFAASAYKEVSTGYVA